MGDCLLPSFDDIMDSDFSSGYDAPSSIYNSSCVEPTDVYATDALNEVVTAPVLSKSVILDVSHDLAAHDLEQIMQSKIDNDEVSLCLTSKAELNSGDQILHKLLSSFSTELP